MGRVKDSLLENVANGHLPKRQVFFRFKSGSEHYLNITAVNELLDNARQEFQNGNIVEAMEHTFRAGMLWEGGYWALERASGAGDLASANEARSTKRISKKDAAIAELRRRHELSPDLNKMDVIRHMANVEDGKTWGKFDTIKKYCLGVRLSKKKMPTRSQRTPIK